MYVVVPRGQLQQSFLPDGSLQGKQFAAKYGYVGICVENDAFVMEGINEAGLGAGLFYFPQYGEYQPYDPNKKDQSVSDMQLVAWILSNFATINELRAGIKDIRVIATDPRASTVHWRITESSGRQVVLEIVNQKVRFYENPLGVITNAPDFQWHLTNLNNYVNLFPGDAQRQILGKQELFPLGGNSGFLGLPGDATPPSRFVRAAFYRATAPQLDDAFSTVKQCFHILNNFDLPIGAEHPQGTSPDIPSATHWTSAIDLTHRKVYFKTAYNNTIRCIELAKIDFDKVKYQVHPFDKVKEQPVERIVIR
jgi:choloylglycine hydrolase